MPVAVSAGTETGSFLPISSAAVKAMNSYVPPLQGPPTVRIAAGNDKIYFKTTIDFCSPPRPSATTILLSDVGRSLKTNRVVDNRLRQGLKLGRYPQYSFVACKDGFAVATPPEEIRDDGTPNPDKRWVNEDSPALPDGLFAKLKGLIWGRTGRYRIFVFRLTMDLTSGEALPVPYRNLVERQQSGSNALDAASLTRKVNPSAILTASAYEFFAHKGQDEKFIERGIPIGQQLMNTGIQFEGLK